MPSDLVYNVFAWLLSVAVAGVLLKLHTVAADVKILPQSRVRKGLHITTGLVYVATWTMYSDATYAKYLAVITPTIHTLRTVGVYLGVYHSQELLDIMTRSGRQEEMSQGPIWYGLVLITATLAFWRTSPAGIAAVAVMCAGDGCAELAGQLLRGPRWPYNQRKTLVGSSALAGVGFLVAYGYTQWFCSRGYFACSTGHSAGILGVAAVVAAAVESLPVETWLNDNLSVPLVVAAVMSVARVDARH